MGFKRAALLDKRLRTAEHCRKRAGDPVKTALAARAFLKGAESAKEKRAGAMKGKSQKIALVSGGPGPESKISRQSARAVSRVLSKRRASFSFIEADRRLCQNLESYSPDLVFLATHGRGGEDGLPQAVCELLALPYTGSGVLASALCMDKLFFKKLLRNFKIPTPDWLKIEDPKNLKRSAGFEKFPFMVKASHGGSTLGTYIVRTERALKTTVQKAAGLGASVFLEKFIPDGKEIAVSFLNGRILTPLEIVPKGGFYDFKRKYTKGETQYFIPARLSHRVLSKIKDLAEKAAGMAEIRSYGRLDFIVDTQNRPFLLEANTLPGLTENSLLPKSAAYDGVPFPRLIEMILEGARTDA